MQKILSFLIFSILSISSTAFLYAHSGINLEEHIQDFVLETKKIEIPSSPHAFNPSIVRWQGRLLLSYREISDKHNISKLSSSSESIIGLVWLDEDFNPISDPQILPLNINDNNTAVMHSEDARLIIISERLYAVYSGNSNDIINDEGFRMYIAELDFDGMNFHVVNNECLSIFEGRSKNRREKNWIPFEHEGELKLAYGMFPHRILKPLLGGTKTCETVAVTYPSIVWDWGELRGGTPGLPINDELYLSFFHSSVYLSTQHSQNKCVPHYFMGAYTFRRESPFEIKQISPEPIIGKNFYQGAVYPPYWHPVNVVFPCGFIFDEQYIWISYGRQDHEIWIAKLNKQGLFDSLIQVSTLKQVKGDRI